MKKQTLFIVLIFFCIYSCKDKPQNPADNINYVPTEVKEFGYFKKGTYWIYQDSATQVLDSVYVVSDTTFMMVFDEADNVGYVGEYEGIDVQAISSLDGYNYHYWGNMTYSQPVKNSPLSTRFKYYVVKSKPGNYIGQNLFIEHYFIFNLTHYDNYGGEQIYLRRDAMVLNNVNYDDVVEYKYLKNNHFDKKDTRQWICKNIGTIRTEVSSLNQVWNLIRYHIVQ